MQHTNKGLGAVLLVLSLLAMHVLCGSAGSSPRKLQEAGCGIGVGHCPKPYCCSKWGFCGDTDVHCGEGCQPGFGRCGGDGGVGGGVHGGSCSREHTVQSGDYCYGIATEYGLQLDEFFALNPSINHDCTDLLVGSKVCVAGGASPPAANPLTSTHSGKESSCRVEHTVAHGESCWAISQHYGLTLDQFFALNPSIDRQCTSLHVGRQVCVGSSGSAATASPPPPRGSGGSNSCHRHHTVADGESCWAISQQYGITLDQFFALNPSIDRQCRSLHVGQQVCVGGGGSAPTVSPPPPASGGGNSCRRHHTVADGESCWAISQQYGITLDQFFALNPSVDVGCRSLRAGQEVCVLGGAHPTSSPPPPGHNIRSPPPSTPPTPPPPARKVNCKLYHTVTKGQFCYQIAVRYNLNLEQLQSLNPKLKCTLLKPKQKLCVRDDHLVPGMSRTICSLPYVVSSGDTCEGIAQEHGITLESLRGLNPMVQCGPGLQAGNTLCLRGVRVQPDDDFEAVENPKRMEVLQDIAAGLENVDPQLRDLITQLMRSPSMALSNAIGLQIATILSRTENLGEARALEKQYGRQRWEQILFPLGAHQYCRQMTLPNSAGMHCLCNEEGSPLIHCASLLYFDLQREAEAGGARARAAAGSADARRRRKLMSGQVRYRSSAAGATVREAVMVAADPLRAAQLAMPANSSWGGRALRQNCGGGGGLTDEMAGAAGEFLNMAEATKKFSLLSVCSASIDRKMTDNPKFLARKDKVVASKTFKKLSSIQDCSKVAKVTEKVTSLLSEDAFCCSPEACASFFELIDVCVEGSVCLPNPVGSLAKGGFETCFDDAEKGTECWVIDWKSEALESLVTLKAGITLKVCFLSIITDLVGWLGVGDICAKIGSLEFEIMKGMMKLETGFSILVVGGGISFNLKTWDFPGICDNDVFRCKEWCVMRPGDYYGEGTMWWSLPILGQHDFPSFPRRIGRKFECPEPTDLIKQTVPDKLVVYTTDWAQWRGSNNGRPTWCDPYKTTPKHIHASVPTHVNYAFAKVEAGTFKVVNVEANEDKLIEELQALKQTNGDLKTLVSIGGWSFSRGSEVFTGTGSQTIFPAMASTAGNRAAFISSAIEYARSKGFNGIDIDWEFPNFEGSNPQEVSDYSSLLSELWDAVYQEASGGDRLLVTIAVRASPTPGDHLDVGVIKDKVDHVNIMSYDFHGAFDVVGGVGKVNHNAPIVDCTNQDKPFDIRASLDAYIAAGLDPGKMALGLATYGRGFATPAGGDITPGRGPATGANAAGDCTLTPGVLSYYEVKHMVPESDWKYDPTAMAAYASYNGGTQWIGFDNRESLRQKVCYARFRGIKGLMVWDADVDDDFELISHVKDMMDDPCEGWVEPTC